MPANDDTPKLEPLVGASLTAADSSDTSEIQRGDILQVWDASAKKMKRITVQEFGEALGVVFT